MLVSSRLNVGAEPSTTGGITTARRRAAVWACLDCRSFPKPPPLPKCERTAAVDRTLPLPITAAAWCSPCPEQAAMHTPIPSTHSDHDYTYFAHPQASPRRNTE